MLGISPSLGSTAGLANVHSGSSGCSTLTHDPGRHAVSTSIAVAVALASTSAGSYAGNSGCVSTSGLFIL